MGKYIQKSQKAHPKGFTMIELIVVIGLFGIISSILMSNLLSVYHFRDVIRHKKDLNFEASSILNNGIPGLVRSGFAINYNFTDSGSSNSIINTENDQEPSKGMQEDVDQISVYTDRAESQYFTIFRKSYVSSGDDSDTAPLYISFSNGEGVIEEFPLHTSEVVIEDFDIEVPVDPRIGGDKDIQPYVSIYIRLRKRYPFGEIVNEEDIDAYKTIRASYKTTIALRNANAASNKTIPIAQ